MIRLANDDDQRYLAEACIRICQHMQGSEASPYVENLPTEVRLQELRWISSILRDENSVAFVAETDQPGRQSIGCIFGSIEKSHMPVAISEPIGHIKVCWVEPDCRGRGTGQQLVSAIQDWFANRGVTVLEVSWLCCNELADHFWQQSGFRTVRVFGWKSLTLRNSAG
tara:strand:+ start:135 stop:638 length:504 start_codon:yes stop_codon:yes gene_type:complete